MTLKDYAEVLKLAIKLQIDGVEEELNEATATNEDYLEGIKQGLEIALQKIDASMLLTEK